MRALLAFVLCLLAAPLSGQVGLSFRDIPFLGVLTTNTVVPPTPGTIWIEQLSYDTPDSINLNMCQMVTNLMGSNIVITKVAFLLSQPNVEAANLQCFIRDAPNNGGNVYPGGESSLVNFSDANWSEQEFVFATNCVITNNATIYVTIVSEATTPGNEYQIQYVTGDSANAYDSWDYYMWRNDEADDQWDLWFKIYRVP